MKLEFEVENVFLTDEPREAKSRLPFRLNISARENGNVHHLVIHFNERLAIKMKERIDSEIETWGKS